jgi:ribonuclease HI
MDLELLKIKLIVDPNFHHLRDYILRITDQKVIKKFIRKEKIGKKRFSNKSNAYLCNYISTLITIGDPSYSIKNYVVVKIENNGYVGLCIEGNLPPKIGKIKNHNCVCNICKKISQTQYTFPISIKNHHPGAIICELCSFKIVDLAEHVIIKIGNKFICDHIFLKIFLILDKFNISLVSDCVNIISVLLFRLIILDLINSDDLNIFKKMKNNENNLIENTKNSICETPTDKYVNMSTVIECYTDGSCKKNPDGPGGWGFLAMEPSGVNNDIILHYEDWGGCESTTNQIMEAEAIYQLLDFLLVGCTANIYSDSEYVLKAIVSPNTLKELTSLQNPMNGWLTKKAGIRRMLKPSDTNDKYDKSYWKILPANDEIWWRIHKSLLRHISGGSKLSFCWVKSHSGVYGNEYADSLSNRWYNERNKK